MCIDSSVCESPEEKEENKHWYARWWYSELVGVKLPEFESDIIDVREDIDEKKETTTVLFYKSLKGQMWRRAFEGRHAKRRVWDRGIREGLLEGRWRAIGVEVDSRVQGGDTDRTHVLALIKDPVLSSSPA